MCKWMFWTGNLEPRTHSHDFFLGTTQQVPKAQLLIMLYTVPVLNCTGTGTEPLFEPGVQRGREWCTRLHLRR